ncbi:hypothetical protein BDV96DRAFT_561997 [Lophiotrema nucula]|uniref:RRM domain-containing protein n=1 Tax=Lophiotrema nucula TaxID=690887 RepID=A0A6A5ZVQ1_9PLEO|nr:hypothetical protein BDV96DRAFT_561997 [Lophiotrema nucula]
MTSSPRRPPSHWNLISLTNERRAMSARSLAHIIQSFSPTRLARLCSRVMSRATTPAVDFMSLELSGFSSKLTADDIDTIFKDYTIANFHFPHPPNFSYPFRLQLRIVSSGEANKAVQEIDGRLVHGKRISLKIVDTEAQKLWEAEVSRVAAMVQTNTARVDHRQHSCKILEVRELVTSTHHYAFLQARQPLTFHSSPQEHLAAARQSFEWEFVAGEFATVKDPSEKKSGGRNLYSGRLEALSDLMRVVEGAAMKRKQLLHSKRQLGLKDTWEHWEGSWLADY